MQTGYVPSNYVRKEKPSIFDSIKKKVCFLLKNGNKLFHIFFDPRWRVAGTKAQEAELSHPQTQVLCTVFPLPLIQVRSSSLSYKWARSSSFFMNILSNVTLYYVWTATNESFLHNTISTTIFSIPLLHPILLLLRYESYLSLFSSTTFFSTPLLLLFAFSQAFILSESSFFPPSPLPSLSLHSLAGPLLFSCPGDWAGIDWRSCQLFEQCAVVASLSNFASRGRQGALSAPPALPK